MVAFRLRQQAAFGPEHALRVHHVFARVADRRERRHQRGDARARPADAGGDRGQLLDVMIRPVVNVLGAIGDKISVGRKGNDAPVEDNPSLWGDFSLPEMAFLPAKIEFGNRRMSSRVSPMRSEVSRPPPESSRMRLGKAETADGKNENPSRDNPEAAFPRAEVATGKAEVPSLPSLIPSGNSPPPLPAPKMRIPTAEIPRRAGVE